MDPFRFGPWVSEEAVAMFRAEAEALGANPAPADLPALRLYYDAFNRRHLETALAAYPVEIAEEEIAGAKVHRVTPPEIAHPDRVLICLHGGAFMWGAGAGALLEAVPVASVAKTRVIAVDYSLAPEHPFPIAVDEVLGVYRSLLETHAAPNIGIYGCSAGAGLTAQVTARIIAEGLPLPGGIAMLHAAGLDLGGDSLSAAPALLGGPDQADTPGLAQSPYFAGQDPNNPLAFPGNHPAVLASFPPALLVTGSRDFISSPVTVMHRRLLAAGVDARLIYFDGMWHAHHMATTIPEARETFAVLADFFDRTLG